MSKMHQLADLVTDLKEKFDYVIIDAPPVLPLADMQVLASMADLLAYVVKASMTGRDVVQKALKVIGETAHVGIILNGLDAHTTPKNKIIRARPTAHATPHGHSPYAVR